MRTNIVIDDKLMRDALRATGLKTKREAVELGLQTLVRLHKQSEIRSLRGKVDWQGDLEAMRTDKCDFSIWIDYFRVSSTSQTDRLDSLLLSQPLAIGDLILAEVLQGFAGEREFEQAKNFLTSLTIVELSSQGIAIQAARNFRALRRLGITVRKTIDAIIATRCIESGYDLLHNDRDFDPFVRHLGLRSVI